MNYDEWIDSINLLVNKYDEEIKNKLLNEKENNNLDYMIEPKLIDLIKTKFNSCVMKIKSSLDVVLNDNYTLDMTLCDFKKKVKFIIELLDIKALSEDKRKELYETLKDGTESVYDILLNEAIMIDRTGAYEMTIKNNRIKWS